MGLEVEFREAGGGEQGLGIPDTGALARSGLGAAEPGSVASTSPPFQDARRGCSPSGWTGSGVVPSWAKWELELQGSPWQFGAGDLVWVLGLRVFCPSQFY